jgi:hypothetical protein
VAWASNCERKVRTLRDDRLSKPMSASKISPLRGSTWLGPMAPKEGCALVIHFTEATPTSSVSKSASSGCCFTTMASLKPIFSKALFHSKMPLLIDARYFTGMLRSSQ